MPEEKKKSDAMVDIDTSGPGADIELDVKQPEQEKEYETSTDDTKSSDTAAKSNEQPAVETKKETEIKDQGTEENVPANDQKKELDDYSEGVQKRIAKLTKKMREAERQREAAIDYARKVHAEKETLTGRLNKLDTGYVTEMENRIKSSMEAAASRLGQARMDGDLKAEIAAQTEIARLGYEEGRLAEIKSKQALEVKVDNVKPVQEYREQPTYQQPEQPINPDPKARDWADKNQWFGKDEPMTYTAFSLHKRLVEEEGYDPQSDEYYTEINKRIRLEFPHKFATTGSQSTENVKPTQTVASASRVSRTAGRKIVKLTSSQVAIAKKLGVPLEEYAKQLNITKEV